MSAPPDERRRAALSRAALEAVEPMLEAGDSYAEVSVERIIRTVGISRSTFYVYFKDKGDLLQAMTVDLTADLISAGQSWFSFGAGGTRDEFHAALLPLFDTYRRHRAALGAVAETAAYDARVREGQDALVQAAVDGLAGQIAEARSPAAAGLDPLLTARWITAMLERGLERLVAPAPQAEADGLLDTVTDMLYRLLYA